MKRVLLVGVGGWAREHWIPNVWPAFRDRVEIAGIVDTNSAALDWAGSELSVPLRKRYTSMAAGFQSADAHFCAVVVSPHAHAEAYLHAASAGMHILSEKPITLSHRDLLRVVAAVNARTLKMAVTQNYRYDEHIVALRDVLSSGSLGAVNYIVARYASDYRQPGSWDVGDAHEMLDPLLCEGAIHHFDMLRCLSGSNCRRLGGATWNAEWSSFRGDSTALFLLEMENGVRCVYEGNSLAAGGTNAWHREAYRVECERGTAAVDASLRVTVTTREKGGRERRETIHTWRPRLAGHLPVVQGFLDWLDGLPPPETQLSDNVNSAAMTFAALEAARTGQFVEVGRFLPPDTPP